MRIAGSYSHLFKSDTNEGVIDWSYGMKPLFCLAYVDPGIESQKGQEKAVANFPDRMPHAKARMNSKIAEEQIGF